MRRALGCARIEARLTWLTQLSWRSMSSRQFKWMKGSELTADAHLRAIEMRVKVREPTVAARADEGFKNCRPKSVGKTAVVRCAVDWVGRHWGYCSRRVAAPYRRHGARPYASSLLADSSLAAREHATRAMEPSLLLERACSGRKRNFHFFYFLGRVRPH